MQRLLLIALLISLTIACSEPQVVDLPSAVTPTLEEIDNYEFEAAAANLDERLEGGEDSNWVDYGHGLIAERQLQFHEVLNRYYAILNRDEDFAMAHGGIARAYAALDKPLKAVGAAKEYVDLAGYGGEAGLLLASTYVGALQFEEARETLENAVSAGADGTIAQLIEARSMYLEGDFDAARDEMNEALSGSLESPKVITEAANCLEVFGLHDSSMVLSRKAHQISGESSETMVNHVLRAIRLDYLYEARQYLEELIEKDEQARLAPLAECLYHLQDDNLLGAVNSLSAYRKACGPTIDPPIYDMKVRLLATDVISAQMMLEEIEGVLNRQPHSPRFKDFMAEELMWGYLGIKMEANAGNRFEAFEHMQAGSAEWEWIRVNIMAVFGVTDQYNDGVDKLLDRFNNDPAWMTRIADISAYGEGLIFEHAERMYRQVLEERPTYYPALKGLVHMLVDQYRFADAHTVCETYAPMVSHSPFLSVEHAIISTRTGRVDQGLALFNDNIGLLKANLTVFDRFLSALEQKGAVEGMKRVLDMMATLNGDNADALIRAAEWRTDIKDFEVAVELIDQVQQLDPDNFSALVQKARVTYEMGNKTRGLAMFDSLYSAVASVPELCLYYSRALATEKSEMALAANLARGAVVTGRNMLKSWYNLCYVYVQEGKYPEAAGKARQSGQMYPKDPLSFYWQGKSRYLEGNDEAREHLQKAVELGIWGDYLSDTQQMLDKLK